MKTLLTIFIVFLTYTTSYGQLTGCFKKSNREFDSTLNFNEDGTFSHKIITKGHLSITYLEKGNYTIKGDSILFKVTEYGINENELQPQPGSLIRNGVLKNKAIILLAKKSKAHEKLRKAKCLKKL